MKTITICQMSVKNSRVYDTYDTDPLNSVEVKEEMIHWGNRRRRFDHFTYIRAQTGWVFRNRHADPKYTRFWMNKNEAFALTACFIAAKTKTKAKS